MRMAATPREAPSRWLSVQNRRIGARTEKVRALDRTNGRGAPASLGRRPVSGSRVTAGHPCESTRYAMICGIGTPWTSVSRMSRPL